MDTISKFDIITEAMEILGVLGEGEEPSQIQVESSLRTLNMIIKAWQTEGINVWSVDTITIPITQGDEVYTIGPGQDVEMAHRPIQLLNGVYRSEQQTDIPINIWSKEEYWRLSTKETVGNTLNVYPDRRKERMDLYVWPTGTGQAGEELVLQLQRGLDGSNDDSADVDVPAEYFLALSYQLAVNLANKFSSSVQKIQSVMRLARAYKEDAEGYNREQGSVYIEPDPHSYGMYT